MLKVQIESFRVEIRKKRSSTPSQLIGDALTPDSKETKYAKRNKQHEKTFRPSSSAEALGVRGVELDRNDTVVRHRGQGT